MATKTVVEASDVVEDVKELVEDTAELVEDGRKWIVTNPKVLVFGAILAGVAVGSAATYLVVSKRLKEKYRREADEQIEDVKNHYYTTIVVRDDAKGDLDELAAKYREETIEERAVASEIISENGYTSYDKVPPAEDEPEISVTQAIMEAAAPRERNVFESDDPDIYFDLEEELERRRARPNEPYVITKDEFDQGEMDFNQSQLTYFDGDGVLTDSQDTPIDDIDKIIGNENVLRFGHASGDPKIVYIRNARLELDFEVTHSDGKFAKEILGFDDPSERELRHAHRQPRRFRPSDE